ncbi:enhanced intracellular survival protein Eis [Marinicrinis lubricantis]|uniref:Enhanced intracellular survival protein Eis n=1 Tax=Marinicrinis lubricantis TaxID=2086470 RepID=A0ABW1IW44_9BACL
MEVHIRNLKYEELDAASELSSFAFQMDLNPAVLSSRRLGQQANLDQVWGAFDEEERLLAKLHLLPFHIRIGGRLIPMGGIAGVATWPEYRRQGLVAGLLRHSLERMRSEGITISMLHPFSFAFYRRYGWETFVEYKRYTLDMKQVPKRSLDTAMKIRRIPGKQRAWQLMDEVYRTFSMQYNGMLDRTEEWWISRVISDDLQLYVVENTEKDMAEGYMMYRVKDKKMHIEELIYVSEKARQALWNLIGNHDSMARELTLQAPADDDLTYVLDDPRIGQEIVPYFMARIVEVKGFIEAYPFARGEEIAFSLHVTDQHAPWNDGGFHIRIDEDGRASVNKLDVLEQAEGRQSIACSIQHLTAWLLGYTSDERLLRKECISGDSETIARFSNRLTGLTTYFPDFF